MEGILSDQSSLDCYDICDCGNLLYSANTQCVACGAVVGYDALAQVVTSFSTDVSSGHWLATNPKLAGRAFRPCSQRVSACNCNWMLDESIVGESCISCQLTLTIPQLDVQDNARLWGKTEIAKRRVLAQLLRLRLPFSRMDLVAIPLGFKFMASLPGEFVLTGHEAGVITLNISEADDSEREAMRERMGEKYRSLAGHIRHELGHYYWDLLSQDQAWIEGFRTHFGDERIDYSSALQNHHQAGAPTSWPLNHISAYASCHPWEDWAETFGYFLHLEEGLSLARHFGLESNDLHLAVSRFSTASLPASAEQYNNVEFLADVNRWVRLSLFINELAEGLGHAHPSPFILNVATVAKLWYVQRSLDKLRAGR